MNDLVVLTDNDERYLVIHSIYENEIKKPTVVDLATANSYTSILNLKNKADSKDIKAQKIYEILSEKDKKDLEKLKDSKNFTLKLNQRLIKNIKSKLNIEMSKYKFDIEEIIIDNVVDADKDSRIFITIKKDEIERSFDNLKINSVGANENFNRLIKATYDYKPELINKLSKHGYLSHNIHNTRASKLNESISTLIFGKLIFFKDIDYSKDTFNRDHNYMISFKNIRGAINCNRFLSSRLVYEKALEEFEEMISILGIDGLAEAANSRVLTLENKLKSIKKSVEDNRKLVHDIMHSELEDELDINDYIDLDVGIDSVNTSPELTDFNYDISLKNFLQFDKMVKACLKVRAEKMEIDPKIVLRGFDTPLITDKYLIQLFDQYFFDMSHNRAAGAELARKKILTRISKALVIDKDTYNVRMVFREAPLEEINLYGNPLNGSCRLCVGKGFGGY